jgi:hypothetical protein
MILRRLVLEMIRGISDTTLALQKQLVFENVIGDALDEAFTRSSTRNTRDAIVALDSSRVKPAGKIDRVYAPNVSAEEFKQMIEKEFNTTVDIIKPGEEGSKSSKFSTFKFKTGDKEESIVLAKGIVAGEEGEKKQEASINDQIKQAGSITLEIIDTEGKKHHIENITGFSKVTGNKKADFVFTGGDKIYVQHKSPSHQQMSGVAKFDRKEYPELDAFINKVKKEVKNSPNGRLDKPMYQPIKDSELKKLAVYGSQDGTPNGVQIYAVGNLSLEGEGKVKKLAASKTYTYPEVPEGEDAPVLGATYRLDRNQYGIPNVRFGIYPASYFKGSKS